VAVGDEQRVTWDSSDVREAIERARDEHVIDARGVLVDASLLAELLEAAGRQLSSAHFESAEFKGRADFRDVVFGEAAFDDAVFRHSATFTGAMFGGDASFRNVAFEGVGVFGLANQRGRFELRNEPRSKEAYAGTDFSLTTFVKRASFAGAVFRGGATFAGTRFRKGVTFAASFWQDASFVRTSFGDSALVGPLVIVGHAILDGVDIGPDASLALAASSASFTGARFRGRSTIGVSWAEIAFDGARFDDQTLIARDSRTLDGIVSAHAELELRDGWSRPGSADLEDVIKSACGFEAEALQRRLIRFDARYPELAEMDPEEEAWLLRICRQRQSHRTASPRILSVAETDLSNVTFADVDLRACRFVGARGLETLRVERPMFPVTPSGGRWTRRLAVADEYDLRRWRAPAQELPEWHSAGPPTPSSLEVAAVYRSLRKGLEDSKDEPGAADFYYGEMEMRRHAVRSQARARAGIKRPSREEEQPPPDGPRAQRREEHHRWEFSQVFDQEWQEAMAGLPTLPEFPRLRRVGRHIGALVFGAVALMRAAARAVLTRVRLASERVVLYLYWALSGYGLRASRSLIALVVTIAAFSLAFSAVGFQPRPYPEQTSFDSESDREAYMATRDPQGWARRLEATTYSAGTATAIISGPEAALTDTGRVLRVVLRILGPILLGLTLLAIRGRVKR
jgi:uncharacterized protein YjbI with pentapeptide repeats